MVAVANRRIVLAFIKMVTKAMGLEPGDEFEIKLGYKHIHLIQVDADKKTSHLDIDPEDDELEEDEDDDEDDDE